MKPHEIRAFRRAADEEQLKPATSVLHPFEAELRFTETYKRYREAPVAIREAMCLKEQHPGAFCSIESGDLIAGRIRPRLVGFSPDEWGSCAFGFYHLPSAIRETAARLGLDGELREQVEAMAAFWDQESTAARVRHAYPPEMAAALPSDDWMNAYGIAFPLYRLTGGNVDYGKLMQRGIPGLVQEVEVRREEAAGRGEDASLYEGLCTALEVLVDVCRFYEQQARALAAATRDANRVQELLDMAGTLAGLTVCPPTTFRAAVQLFWLYALTGDIRNHGRMDVYLGDFLAYDLEHGVITEQEALALLQSLWRLMAARATRVHNRVIVGGRGRPNEAHADRFALLAMEATRRVHAAEPQLSLRFYVGQNPALKQKALDVLAEGRTFPILYNDDAAIPSVEKAFGFPPEEAAQYVPYGCGEYILEHRSFGTPSGVINLLKALEVTLHDGVDPMTGQKMGLSLGAFRDFGSFEALWHAYTRQVEHYVSILADQEALEYQVAGEQAAFLYLSLLYDDCLARGKGIFSGGIRYLGGTLETYGNTNTADSLTAIKSLVYDRKLLEPDQMLHALDENFAGYEKERRLLLDAPKYGNDDDVADGMLVKVHEHVCNAVRNQVGRVPLHSYLVVVINNSANALMGRWTGASADGRLQRMPMNNGNAPSSGNDGKGVTALLNSLLKPSHAIHAGAVQNLKFSRDLFTNHRSQLLALLDVYFGSGGAQAMITVVNRGDLENAMKEPEKYRHVFVRVGGFSARFVDLPRDVQLEILNRTLY